MKHKQRLFCGDVSHPIEQTGLNALVECYSAIFLNAKQWQQEIEFLIIYKRIPHLVFISPLCMFTQLDILLLKT